MRLLMITFFVVMPALVVGYILLLQGAALVPVSTKDPVYTRLSQIDAKKPTLSRNRGNLLHFSKLYFRWAIAKFPNLEACQSSDVEKSAPSKGFAWKRIKTKEQFEVCFYHLLQNVDGNAAFTDWLDQASIIYRSREGVEFKDDNYQPNGEIIISISIFKQPNSDIGNSTAPYLFVAKVLGGKPVFQVNFDNADKPYSIGHYFNYE